jgi:hypothetical protein
VITTPPTIATTHIRAVEMNEDRADVEAAGMGARDEGEHESRPSARRGLHVGLHLPVRWDTEMGPSPGLRRRFCYPMDPRGTRPNRRARVEALRRAIFSGRRGRPCPAWKRAADGRARDVALRALGLRQPVYGDEECDLGLHARVGGRAGEAAMAGVRQACKSSDPRAGVSGPRRRRVTGPPRR